MKNLKVGDNVMVCSSGLTNYQETKAIKAETPKQWIVGGEKFWKKNGYAVGSTRRYIVRAEERETK